MSQESLIILLAGFSVGMMLWTILSGLSREKDAQKASKGENRFQGEPAPGWVQALLPLSSGIALNIDDWLRAKDPQRKGKVAGILNHFEKTILMAGSPGGLRSAEVPAMMIVSALVCGVAMALFSIATEYPVLPVATFSMLLGFALPALWLSDKVKRRHIEVRKDMPYMLDLLTLCVEAGMDFTTALTRIVSRLGTTALSYELRQLLREVQIGKSRSEALKDLSKRIGLIELATVVNAIVQSEQLGSSMGPTLRIQAEEARRRRSLRAEEMAMKAPVKLLFPLVIFIFPTTFIVIFGPVFIKHLPVLQNLGQ